MSRSKPLRAAMPETAAWIDQLREAFGAPEIEPLIKAGISGEPVFWAKEAGREIGTRGPTDGLSWRGEGLEDRHYCRGCSGECIGRASSCRRARTP